MTERNTWDVLMQTCPGCNRLKVVDDKVVFLHWEGPDLLIDIARAVPAECLYDVHATALAKIKAKTLRLVLHRMFQLDVCLSATDKKIKLSVRLQNRNDIFCPGDVAVAGALDCI